MFWVFFFVVVAHSFLAQKGGDEEEEEEEEEILKVKSSSAVPAWNSNKKKGGVAAWGRLNPTCDPLPVSLSFFWGGSLSFCSFFFYRVFRGKKRKPRIIPDPSWLGGKSCERAAGFLFVFLFACSVPFFVDFYFFFVGRPSIAGKFPMRVRHLNISCSF